MHSYLVPAHRPWSKLWRCVLLLQRHLEICSTTDEQGEKEIERESGGIERGGGRSRVREETGREDEGKGEGK